jgi:hypothetical protein
LKINAGSFGMFNNPGIPLVPRTPAKGKKRKRVKEYSDYPESPRLRRRKEWRCREEVIELSDDDEEEREQAIKTSDDDEEEQALSVSESAAPARQDERENDVEHPHNCQEYLNTLNLVKSAETRVRIAESNLATYISEQKGIELKLALSMQR